MIKRAANYHRTTKSEQTLFPQTTTSSCSCWSFSMAQRATCRTRSNQMLSFQSKSRIYLKPTGNISILLIWFQNIQFSVVYAVFMCVKSMFKCSMCTTSRRPKKLPAVSNLEVHKATQNATCVTLFIPLWTYHESLVDSLPTTKLSWQACHFSNSLWALM